MHNKNIITIYDLIKDCRLSSDDVVYDCILKSKVFSCISHTVSDVIKLRQISCGDDKVVYISNDAKLVYKILNCTVNKDWKNIIKITGVSNLFLQLEQLYLLNEILKNDFDTDIVSIEKLSSEYVFVFTQPYKKEVFCNKSASIEDILRLKIKLHIYMKKHGFIFCKDKSRDIDDTYFEYVYHNGKYLLYDLSLDNITLNNNQLFFYDLNCIRLEYYQNIADLDMLNS